MRRGRRPEPTGSRSRRAGSHSLEAECLFAGMVATGCGSRFPRSSSASFSASRHVTEATLSAEGLWEGFGSGRRRGGRPPCRPQAPRRRLATPLAFPGSADQEQVWSLFQNSWSATRETSGETEKDGRGSDGVRRVGEPGRSVSPRGAGGAGGGCGGLGWAGGLRGGGLWGGGWAGLTGAAVGSAPSTRDSSAVMPLAGGRGGTWVGSQGASPRR